MCTDGSGNPLIAGQLYDPYSGYNDPDCWGRASRKAIIPNNKVGTYISPGTAGLLIPPFPALPAQYQPVAGVPGNLIDPVAQNVMNAFPMPTPGFSNPSLYNNWTASGATPSKGDQFDIKIDHRFSEKNLLSAKYSQQWGSNAPFDCFNSIIDPCGSGSNREHGACVRDQRCLHVQPDHAADHDLWDYARRRCEFLPTTRAMVPILWARWASRHTCRRMVSMAFPPCLLTIIGPQAFTNAGNDPYGNYKQGQDTGQLSVDAEQDPWSA